MQENSTSTEMNEVARSIATDAQWTAWYTIISGGIACLTIIGAIIGVPLVIAGLRLKESNEAMLSFAGSSSPAALLEAMQKQKSYWNIQKIFIIIALVFVVLYFVVVVPMLMTILGKMGGAMPTE